jgi:two-component system sensor histidine kinase RegB
MGTLTESASLERRYYLSLLSFLLLLWSVTLTWFHFELQMHFAYAPVVLVLLLFAMTLGWASRSRYLNRLRQSKRTFNPLWFALLVWILVLNSVLLYYTGGSINPLIHLLLLPLVLGMLILSALWFWALATVAVGLYGLLNFVYVPIMSLKVQSLQAFFAWHLHGSMLAFMLLVLLLAIVILPLKSRLEAQRIALGKRQNQALQNEYLLSVGSLASVSVHKLSTPLNSLALLQELLQSEVKSEQGKAYLHTARQQLEVCMEALQGLRRRAQEALHTSDKGADILTFLSDLRQEFALLHPKSELQIQADQVAGELQADQALKLAFINLLDNASRYSPGFIRLNVKPWKQGWRFCIEDQGGGVAETHLNELGEGMVEDYHGIGMGIFLSRMIIERFGGQLAFENALIEGKTGLRATVFLPDSNRVTEETL